MAKTPSVARDSVMKWFGALGFDAQSKVLGELSAIFERGKAEKIRTLEAELAQLKAGTAMKASPAAVAKKAPAVKANPLSGRKIPPKNAHPKDRTKTWAGRGVQPGWVQEFLKGRGKLEDLLIKK